MPNGQYDTMVSGPVCNITILFSFFILSICRDTSWPNLINIVYIILHSIINIYISQHLASIWGNLFVKERYSTQQDRVKVGIICIIEQVLKSKSMMVRSV